MKTLFLLYLFVLYEISSIEAVKKSSSEDPPLLSELTESSQIATDLINNFETLSSRNTQGDTDAENQAENAQTEETDNSPRLISQQSQRGPPQRLRSSKRPGTTEDIKDERAKEELQLPVSDEDIQIMKRTPAGQVNIVQKMKSPSFQYRNEYYSRELTFTGSTTPYEKCVDTDNLPTIDYPGCRPVRIWSLFRHGTRFPGGETIIGMRTRLKNLRKAIILKYWEYVKNNKPIEEGQSCYSKELEKWKLRKELQQKEKPLSDEVLNENKSKVKIKKKKKGEGEKIDNTKSLTPEGKEEVLQIGKRFKQRFGDLIELAKKHKSFIFKFTDCERTKSSAEEIYRGAFGSDPEGREDWYVPVETGEDGKDPLLKYDSVCTHWKKNYKKSYLAEYDLESFRNGKKIDDTVQGLRKKCGFSEKTFTLSDGKVMYEACAYEKTWPAEEKSITKSNPNDAKPQASLQRLTSKRAKFEDLLKRTDSRSKSKKEDTGSSPWCDILTPEYLEVFEYLEDFEFFNNDGPSNEVNKELGCILFKDMVKRLIGDVFHDGPEIDEEDYKYSTKETKLVTFYVTHLTAVLKFITHLGLFNDPTEFLRADNFDKMKERKWRSSHIGCFATNISFVLMNCGESGEKADYKILTLFQEKPVRLPGCPGKDDLCPMEVFLKVYKDSIFHCRYHQICKTHENPLYEQAYRLLGWQRYSSDKSIKYAIQKERETN